MQTWTYIWTLDSHELFGAFDSPFTAHRYAKRHGLTSYSLETPFTLQPWMIKSFRGRLGYDLEDKR